MPSMESSNHMLPPPQCPALPHDCSGGESYVLQQAPPVWTRRECDVGLVSARNCEDRPGFTQKKMRQSALAVAAFALVALISILVVSDGERRTEDFAKQEFFTGREGDRELARSDSWQYPPPSGDRAPLPHRDSSPIEYAGRGKGWPLKSSGATFQRPERSFDRSHTDEEERETDKGQSWLNVGTYGVVPRVDGNLDGQLEDPKENRPCAENPISVGCTGGFGGGMKSTGGPMATRVLWRRDNEFGWRPEVDGPLKTPRYLTSAFRYLYGRSDGARVSSGERAQGMLALASTQRFR